MEKSILPTATVQKKLVLLLLLSILVPMILFACIFRIYSRREFTEQGLSSMRSGFQSATTSLQDQLQLITYAERSVYANDKVMTALAGDGHFSSIAERQATEDYIFNMLRSISSMVTDASVIHLSSYHLATDYYLTKNFDQYTLPLVRTSIRDDVQAYSSYLQPGKYNPTHIIPVEDTAFTICLPLYNPPSITDSIGLLEVSISRSRLESMCSSLFDAAEGESLLVLTEDNELLYQSQNVESERYTQLLSSIENENEINTFYDDDGVIVLYEHIQFKTVNLKVARIVPITRLSSKVDSFITGLIILLIALMAMAAFLMCLCTVQFTGPLRKLTAYTCAVRDGNLNAQMDDYIVYKAHDEIGTLITDIQDMVQTIHHYIIRQFQLNAENKDIQLKMLQAQINPHFLFNTLQCLAGQALEVNSIQLYSAIASLGQMMHYAMDTNQIMVNLQQEKDYTASYLMLQRMRFPVNLKEQWEISEEALSFPIPKMVLQPLVENAVRHGEILKSDNHTLTIYGDIVDGGLCLRITDDGVGVDEQTASALQDQLTALYDGLRSASMQHDTALSLSNAWEGKEDLQDLKKDVQGMQTHIGLQNVYQRLLLRCGWTCTMQVRGLAPHGFEVSLFIPEGRENEDSIS